MTSQAHVEPPLYTGREERPSHVIRKGEKREGKCEEHVFLFHTVWHVREDGEKKKKKTSHKRKEKLETPKRPEETSEHLSVGATKEKRYHGRAPLHRACSTFPLFLFFLLWNKRLCIARRPFISLSIELDCDVLLSRDRALLGANEPLDILHCHSKAR